MDGPVCVSCGRRARTDPDTGEKAKVYSFGKPTEDDGPVEICSICMKKGGKLVGMTSPDLTAANETELAEQVTENQQLQSQVDTQSLTIRQLIIELGRYIIEPSE